MPVSFHLFINKWMNSIPLTHFSWSSFFLLNSETRWERIPQSKVITQGDRSSVVEGGLRTDRWRRWRQWNEAVAGYCCNKRRSSLILSSCQDTKSWSQLFFKKKKKNAFLSQDIPGQWEQSQHSSATLSGLVDRYFWPFMLNLWSSRAVLPL